MTGAASHRSAEIGERLAIEELKARYCRFVDTKRWDDWRRCFTADCLVELPPRPPVLADELVAASSARLQDAVTVHHVHAPEIVLVSALEATGIWAMADRVEFPEPREHVYGTSRGFAGAGHYEERYRKESGEWRISALRLTRLRLELF